MGMSEALTIQESMRAITIDAAYQSRMENEVGSIDIGKRANFTILNEHPYQVKPGQIKDIVVWGTVFDGSLFPVDKTAQGLVLNQQTQELMASITGEHAGHNHASGDICDANHMYQEILATMD